MDGGTKCSVTNDVDIFQDIVWYDEKNKPTVHMMAATSDQLIVPVAEGLLQIKSNTLDCYLDEQCFYLPHFTSTFLSERCIAFASMY